MCFYLQLKRKTRQQNITKKWRNLKKKNLQKQPKTNVYKLLSILVTQKNNQLFLISRILSARAALFHLSPLLLEKLPFYGRQFKLNQSSYRLTDSGTLYNYLQHQQSKFMQF